MERLPLIGHDVEPVLKLTVRGLTWLPVVVFYTRDAAVDEL